MFANAKSEDCFRFFTTMFIIVKEWINTLTTIALRKLSTICKPLIITLFILIPNTIIVEL